MHLPATTKDALLRAAEEIAYAEGLDQLNIRRVAAACHISVGTVYHYFPAKSDLVFALIENFWSQIIDQTALLCPPGMPFVDYFVLLSSQLAHRLRDFQSAFFRQIATFTAAEKQTGRTIESFYLKQLQDNLLAALRQDTQIPPSVWSSVFTQEAFVEFALARILSLLRSGEADYSFSKELFSRLLVGAPR